MPRYDFRCNTCHEIKEIEENIPPACPMCADLMVRIYSPVGIQFNSPGFYSTDNK